MTAPNVEGATEAPIRQVLIKMSIGSPYIVRVRQDGVQSIVDALTAAWAGEPHEPVLISTPEGVQHLLNPAHIITMELR